MTYTIPPDSPKGAKAAAFGRELVKACHARGVPLKELERAAGIGHTTLDRYRGGLILPRTEAAHALADVLDWPRLAKLIDEARTYVCGRPGCNRTFRNEAGGRKTYCSATCRDIASNIRMAERRARQAGQTDSGRHRANQLQRLRSALRIADERADLLADAIDAMCRECEPLGTCRTEECPLRAYSPLPLSSRLTSQPRTLAAIRSEVGQRPEARAKRSAAMLAHHADPAYSKRHSESLRAAAAARSPEERARWLEAIQAGKARVPAAEKAAAGRKAWETRRARAAEAAAS